VQVVPPCPKHERAQLVPPAPLSSGIGSSSLYDAAAAAEASQTSVLMAESAEATARWNWASTVWQTVCALI